MSDSTTVPEKKKPDASWTPVIISVVVYPGVGQFMQKRQLASTIYVSFFTIVAALFTWTLIVYIREIIPMLLEAWSGERVEETVFPPIGNILKPFAVVMFIYFANVVDVLRGRFDLIRKARES